ncbi:MAG: LysR substrate-binding domain-containing protein [Paraburkholderia fungorum]|nr:LysR substrate-binding domain-containing protein [Paraburkholderia fungorum]
MSKSELMAASVDAKLVATFCVAAEELHFARAAERLFMSQPALSHQIRRLEETVDAELFTRTTRSVQLTPAGVVMLEHARELLRDMERMVRRVRQAARGETGRLSVGLTPTAACSPLAEALHQYRLANPGIELDLHELNSIEMQSALRLRTIDVALMRPTAVDADMRVEVIYREPMYVAMRSDHPLTTKSSVDLAELASYPLVGYRADASPYFRNLIHSAFSIARVVPSFLQDSVLPTLLTLVEAGVGLGVVPESVISARGGNLVYRKLPKREELTAKIVVTECQAQPNPAARPFIISIANPPPQTDTKEAPTS